MHFKIPSANWGLTVINHLQSSSCQLLTQWSGVIHIDYKSVSKIIIGQDIGLLPLRCQAIIQTYTDLLLIRKTTGNKFQLNFNQNTTIFIQENSLENVCKMVTILSGPQWVRLVTRGRAFILLQSGNSGKPWLPIHQTRPSQMQYTPIDGHHQSFRKTIKREHQECKNHKTRVPEVQKS